MYVMLTSTYYESNNAERAWKTLFSLQRSRTVIALLIRTSFSYSTGQAVFKLMAVIVHMGTVDDGHYITYRRFELPQGNEQGSKWLYTSDELVEVTSRDQALSSCAYMLFYERANRSHDNFYQNKMVK